MATIPTDFMQAGAVVLSFDHVLRRLPIGMALLSLDGICEAVDEVYCAIIGCTQEELLHKRCLPANPHQLPLQFRPFSPDSLKSNGPRRQGEQQVLRSDGKLVHIRFKLVPVWGFDGIHRQLVYATDITQLKHAQEKLRQVVTKSQGLLKSHSKTLLYEPAKRTISNKRRGGVASRGASRSRSSVFA